MPHTYRDDILFLIFQRNTIYSQYHKSVDVELHPEFYLGKDPSQFFFFKLKTGLFTKCLQKNHISHTHKKKKITNLIILK